MSIKCKLGFHTWDGCKCTECGKIRDEQHEWEKDCEKCFKCGKTRENQHDWSKDCETCFNCKKTRENQHDWTNCKCPKCGKQQHDWSSDLRYCKKCNLKSGVTLKILQLEYLKIFITEFERFSNMQTDMLLGHTYIKVHKFICDTYQYTNLTKHLTNFKNVVYNEIKYGTFSTFVSKIENEANEDIRQIDKEKNAVKNIIKTKEIIEIFPDNFKRLSNNDICNVLYYNDETKRDKAFKLLLGDKDLTDELYNDKEMIEMFGCFHLERRFDKSALYPHWIVTTKFDRAMLDDNDCTPLEVESPYYYGVLNSVECVN